MSHLSKYNEDNFALNHPFAAWMESFFNNDAVANKLSGWTGDIRVDSSETPDAFNISADLPGVQKENIRVSLNRDRLLTIEAVRKETNEQHDEQSKTHWKERVFGKVQRSFKLPRSANPEDYTCKYDNGVLDIRIRKKEPSSDTNYLTIN